MVAAGRDPVHPSRLRRGVAYGGTLLSLLLLIGLIYLAGGFEKRTDLLEQVPPGELIVTGPYELRFTEATAKPDKDPGGTLRGWDVVVIGQARTTGDETTARRCSTPTAPTPASPAGRWTR